MSNVYSFNNRFRLTIDGLDYIIREPIGWGSVEAEMERDFIKSRFGFTDMLVTDDVQVSFSQDPSNEGNRSFDLLVDLFNQFGSDSQAFFFFETEFDIINNPGVWTVVYSANVDFSPDSFVIRDRIVEATLRTISFENKINSRLRTLIDIKSNIDLDGNIVTTFNPTNLKLHSKVIRLLARGVTNQGNLRVAGAALVNSSNLQPFNEDLNEIEYEDGSRAFIGGVTTAGLGIIPNGWQVDVGGNAGTMFLNIESLDYRYTVSFEGPVELQDFGAVAGTLEMRTILKETVGATTTDIFTETLSVTTPNTSDSATISFSTNLLKSATDTETTSYRVVIEVDESSGNIGNLNAQADYNLTLTITRDTVNPESTVDVWTLDQVGSRLIEAATGQDAYQSDILSVGCASNIGLTNGRFIKAQTEEEFNPKTSLIDFIDSMKFFNMGYGFEGDIFRHEPIEHFFADVETLVIPNVDLDNYNETLFNELYFNNIEIGYKTGFDSEQFFNDDPQGDHQYLLPINNPVEEFDFRSEYIASMYALENKRREQFLRQERSTKFDDDIFLIKTTEISEYDLNEYQYRPNEIQFTEGEYLNIDDGENITVVGGPQAGNYTVGYVRKEGGSTFIVDLTPPIVGTGVFSGPVTVQLGSTKTVPERDENFSSVTNLISPETAYNLTLTPKSSLFNLSLWINSILNFKPGTGIIRNTFVKNNATLTLDPNNNTQVCNQPTRDPYTEGSDISINDLNQGIKLFTGRLCTVRAEIGYDNIVLLQNANKNQLTGPEEPLNRGYVTFETTNGFTRSGWVYRMAYNLNMSVVNLTILEKA